MRMQLHSYEGALYSPNHLLLLLIAVAFYSLHPCSYDQPSDQDLRGDFTSAWSVALYNMQYGIRLIPMSYPSGCEGTLDPRATFTSAFARHQDDEAEGFGGT
jgi:hypothetical protein